jgi:hypothetical protein
MIAAETFGKRQKRENLLVVRLLPGSHERLASRNPCILFQKHGGACTMYLIGVPWYEKQDEKPDSHAAEKGTKKLVSSNFAKILK